ncbi:MAG: pilus assembly protein PilM [Gammaproteobacteria bacterium]|nr:pilus assembly protein PilM [Gammaproteobacteria bacterium]
MSNEHTTDLKSELKSFWAWWTKELATLIPALLTGANNQGKRALLVLLDREKTVFLARRNQHWEELGQFHPGSTAAEVQTIINPRKAKKRQVVARLPHASGLRRELELPLAAEQDLHQVLTHQMDTLSPYPPDEIYFDYQIRGRDIKKRTLQVEVLLAPKHVVDDAVVRLEKWGITPEILDSGELEQTGQPEYNLLPAPLTLQKNRSSLSRLNKLLLVLNLLLLGIMAGNHLFGLASAEAQLQTRMETAKLKADATLKIRARADKLKEEAAFLQNLKRETVPKIAVLDELTRILPDGTWLDRAILEENQIRLFGLSSKASTLISEIEKSSMFQDVAFQAPVVQEKRYSSERFQISADVSVTTSDDN